MRRGIIGITLVAAMAAITATPAAAGSTSDRDVAEAGVVIASDLPDEFVASRGDGSTDKLLVKTAKKVKGCDDYVAVRKAMDKATDAKSPDFQSNVELVNNHVYVFKNEKAATKVLEQAKSEGMADCFTDLFTAVLTKQLKGNPDVENIRVQIEDVPALTDELGDASVGYSGGIEATYTTSAPERFVVSTLLVQVGPSIITYTYQVLPNQNTGALDTAVDNTILRTRIALA